MATVLSWKQSRRILFAAVIGATIAGAAVRGEGPGPPRASRAPTSAPAPTIAPPPAARPILSAPYAPGEILIKFRPGAKSTERATVRGQIGAATRARFRSGAEHWRLPPGLSTEAALARLARDPFVEYAEPNYILAADRLPDDPDLGRLHAFNNTGQLGGMPGADIDVLRAWNITTGSRDVIVAVIDTGVDAAHPDLAANMFTNGGEIAGNGVDDDGNGFVDDARGWDFVNNDNDPYDDNGHGTHVSGTIGAVGDNGIGLAGVAWRVALLPVKFLGSEGFGFSSDAIRSIDYAHQMGARVLNASWGGGAFSLALRDAIAAGAPEGVLFVAAAGNAAVDNDDLPQYPASYHLPNVVGVAATDESDALAPFSNWGGHTVLLGAPGVSILSTVPGGFYSVKKGTSMATPMVVGAVALLDAAEPGLDVETIVARLAASADPLPALAGRTISGGRLNVFRLLARPDDAPPGAIDDLVVEETGSTTARLRFTAPGDDGAQGRASAYDIRVDRDRLDMTRLDDATAFVNRVLPAEAGSVEAIEVDGLLPSTTYAFAVRARDEWETIGPAGSFAIGTTLGPPMLVVSPEAIVETLRVGQTVERLLTIANTGAGTLDWTLERSGPRSGAGGLAPWLGAMPLSGRVRAGGAQAVTLSLDASGLTGGLLEVTLAIRSNDPAWPVAELPVVLTVIDAPVIAIAPAAIDFGTVFTGASAVRSLSITSTGTIDLAVTGVVAGDPAIRVEDAGGAAAGPFVLAPGDTRALAVVWTPAGAATLDTTVVIDSDAANAAAAPPGAAAGAAAGALHAVRLRGVALAPPGIAVDPEAIAVALSSGMSTTRTLRIANPGASALEVSLAADGAGGWLAVTPERATVPAGGAVEAVVTVDAVRRPGGTYGGSLNLVSNVPGRPRVAIPVTLEVADAPHLSIRVPGVVLESRAGFESTGTTAHRLEARVAPAGPGTVEAVVEGDFGSPFEIATVTAEGGTLGTVGGAGGECGTAGRVFSVAPADLAAQLADGMFTAAIGNAPAVDPVCALNQHTLRLEYGVAQDRLDYGALLPGESRRQMVTLENDGSLDLAVAAVTVGGDPLPGPFTLAPGAERAIDVPFAAAAELIVDSDDATRPRAILPLVARRLPSPALEADPTPIDVTLLEGHAVTRAVTLRNRGLEPLEVALTVAGSAAPAASACGTPAWFVASYNSGEVRVVNPATGAATLVAVGLVGPRGLVADRDGRRLHVAEFSGRLATIDIATGAVTRIDTGQTVAQGLALDPAGRAAWLTSYSQGSILRIDLRDGVVTLAARGLAGPHALALDPSGGAAFVVETERGTVARVDLATGVATIAASGLAGARGLALDPTGTVAWVSIATRGVIVEVDLLTGAMRDLASGLANPAEIARDAATGLLLVSEVGADRVVLIDPAGGDVVAAIPGLASPTGIASRDPGACFGRFADPGERRLTLPPGEGTVIDVRFDATGLAPGTWRAAIVTGTARPFVPLLSLSLTLAVMPRPRIAVEGQAIVLDSLKSYSTAAAHTTHLLPAPVVPGAGGLVEVTVAGDYGSARERATVALEGHVIGSLGSVGLDCTAVTATFAVDRATLAAAAADGAIDVTVQNSADVGATCPLNRHRVTVRYPSADTVHGLDFADITVGEARSIPLVVRNDGSAPLAVAAIGASIPACAASPATFTVVPGAARNIAVRCAPTGPGPFEATLLVASDDPDRPAVEVRLAGLGFDPPRMVVDPAAVSASVTEGGTAERGVTLLNTGGRSLMVGVAVVPGAEAGAGVGPSAPPAVGFIQVTPPGVTLPPGEQLALLVVLRAAGLTLGAHAATIVLTANDPARPRVEVPVTVTILPDADRDGVADGEDACPAVANPDQADVDGDRVGDACDTCPATADPGQEDGDADGSGDACQPVLIFQGIRHAGGDRLEVLARAFDPQGEPLSGEIRLEPAESGLTGTPALPPVVFPFDGWQPRLMVITGLTPGTTYRLVLRVTDGVTVAREAGALVLYQGESLLIIDMPPRPAIAAPAVVECDRPLAALARLDGTGSADDDSIPGSAGDIVLHEWYRRADDGGLLSIGAGPLLEGVALPLGVNRVVLRVTDTIGVSSEQEVVVAVRDTAPPSLALAPEPAVLWPPDHAMRRVDLRPVAVDVCDPSPAAILAAVVSSEIVTRVTPGGDSAGSDIGAVPGAACATVELRAERDPSGPGRTYSITCEGSDRSGNRAAATTTVVVPHDQGAARH